MSARFGRNQKRRMRQELADALKSVNTLKDSAAMDGGLLADVSRRLRDAEEHQRRVADMVGSSAIASGVPTKFEGIYHDRFRAIPVENLYSGSYRDSLNAPMSMSQIRYETMRLLNVEIVRSEISRHMQVYVSLADKQVAYAISETALHEMSKPQLLNILEKEIARSMAHLLVKEIAA